jgi:acetylornithine aminotransferase
LLTLADSFLGSFGSAGKKRPEEWFCLDWRACASCAKGEDCDPCCDCLKAIPFERIGGFVFEPGSASGWVRFPPRGLVRALAARVKEMGSLVVVNEVTTGMGRTGTWYGFQHYDLRPDLVAIGKGLGNGYPVSCAAMTAEVAHRLEEGEFRYAQSHQNDPLGCAVASEVVAVLREEDLVARSSRVGASFLAALKSLAGRHAAIQAVRGRGLMIAFELDPARSDISATAVYQDLLERGFLVGISSKSTAPNFVRFDPALIVKEEEIEGLLENLEGVMG